MKTASFASINRLLVTVQIDMRLQAQNGFYAATGFVLAVTGALALLAAQQQIDLGWLLPAVALNNMMITAFYFVAALVLLEKAEGSLQARVVTPLRPHEYLWAKVATLTLLAVVHNGVFAFLLRGTRLNMVLLGMGCVVAAAHLTLAGFAAVARYTTITAYLFPSLPIAAALMFPLLPYTLGWEHPLLYLHPLQAPIELMRAALVPQPIWRIVYGFVYGVCWIAVLFLLARREWRNARPT